MGDQGAAGKIQRKRNEVILGMAKNISHENDEFVTFSKRTIPIPGLIEACCKEREFNEKNRSFIKFNSHVLFSPKKEKMWNVYS